jgi:hypothetical protein
MNMLGVPKYTVNKEEHRVHKRIKTLSSPSPSSSEPGSPSVGGEAEERPQKTRTADDPIIIDL